MQTCKFFLKTRNHGYNNINIYNWRYNILNEKLLNIKWSNF